MDHVERVDRTVPRLEVETVRPERIRLFDIERTRADGIGLAVEPHVGLRRRKQHGGGLLSRADEVQAAAFPVSRGNQPLRAWNNREVFWTDERADELDLSDWLARRRTDGGVAGLLAAGCGSSRSTRLQHGRHEWQEHEQHRRKCFHQITYLPSPNPGVQLG